ncbi:2-oxoglutarate and iron-dependent oxygenase domain-containing protein 2-like [Asterias rubens]|uniref:2-oxoglutarate and iron-dependent oxygenase domain-containing protein 2-like n=1 Tax=Asterias rubens TaxID=7604 RepID=UPI0014553437|nr:2-oxoglutarate and iron-dependent oxygenase domain-containing protein 2-like [Asterias rubens]
MSKVTMKKYYCCKCFLTDNIYISEYDIHVTYHCDDQFLETWQKKLQRRGCSGDKFTEILQKVKSEVERRQNLGAQSLIRRDLISANYTPLHPHVYNIQKNYFSPVFLSIVDACKSGRVNVESLMNMLHQEHAEQVFSFPLFTQQFCQDFIEEICHFESTDLPKGRPNTMNNYGVLLDDLGFGDQFVTPLIQEYLTPITKLLYPDCGGASLDSHKAFVVKYKLGEDLSLAYHYDNAEVTLNVSLGKEFSDGSLYFGDMRWVPPQETACTESTHKPTFALLHRGQHKHGALPIRSGERYNLIIWMRSSVVRNRCCPMCDEAPQLMETVGYGDGLTVDHTREDEMVNVCAAL